MSLPKGASLLFLHGFSVSIIFLLLLLLLLLILLATITTRGLPRPGSHRLNVVLVHFALVRGRKGGQGGQVGGTQLLQGLGHLVQLLLGQHGPRLALGGGGRTGIRPMGWG